MNRGLFEKRPCSPVVGASCCRCCILWCVCCLFCLFSATTNIHFFFNPTSFFPKKHIFFIHLETSSKGLPPGRSWAGGARGRTSGRHRPPPHPCTPTYTLPPTKPMSRHAPLAANGPSLQKARPDWGRAEAARLRRSSPSAAARPGI